MSAEGSRFTVIAALAGNLLVAATKAVAAWWTGSSAMLSEAIHSGVDTGNQILLLYGMRRARARPDVEHPVGFGREVYFWSFVVALLVFALGAGVSLYEGVLHILHPEPIADAQVSYIVLGLAALFEGGSWAVAMRQFRRAQGECSFFEAFRRSKDPPSFMVLFEDSAAMLGILIALLTTYLSVRLQRPTLDGVGSILIGLVLAVVAVLLARESKSLLIGERADVTFHRALLATITSEPGPLRINGILTTQLAPDQVMVALSVDFDDALRTPEIERVVAATEQRIRAAHPEVTLLFVKPQSAADYRNARQRRLGEVAPRRVRQDPA